MERGYYYLSLPYEGSLKEKTYRESLSLKTALSFLDQGIYVFSAVTYVSALIQGMNSPSLEKRRDLLMPYVLQFLKASQGLILLKTVGWDHSWGVHQELLFCESHHIPVFVMEEGDRINPNRLVSKPIAEDQRREYLTKTTPRE